MAAKKDLAVIQNAIAERGIDAPTWSALQNSVYPGAADESILMVVDYCKALKLDPMQKPVHIVPMSVKQGDKYQMRDVVMPGIGLYRIQASRSGDLAGTSSPEFGPDITGQLGSVEITYPLWCKVSVTKLIDGRLVEFTACEFFTENYATKNRNDQSPNAMWAKRPYAQLAKCAEAQALRKGWPEIGQQPTFEEMEGKTTHVVKDITPKNSKTLIEEEIEPDMTWFDNIMAEIANSTNSEAVNTIYNRGLEECQKHSNSEAVEHFKLACKQKLKSLECD